MGSCRASAKVQNQICVFGKMGRILLIFWSARELRFKIFLSPKRWGSVRYFAHICFWAITDDKRELAQPKQPTDLRAPEEQVGCEGGASRLFTLYHLRKVCKYSCTAEFPILLWKYLSAIGSSAHTGNPYTTTFPPRWFLQNLRSVPVSWRVIFRTQERLSVERPLYLLGHELLSVWRQPPGYVSKDTWWKHFDTSAQCTVATLLRERNLQ